MIRKKILFPFLLSVFSFLVYMGNLRPISSGDNKEAGFVAINLVTYGTVYLDQFYKPYLALQPDPPPDFVSYTQHYRANYGTELGIFLSPIYFLLLKCGGFNATNIAYNPLDEHFNPRFRRFLFVAEKTSVSVVAAITVGGMFLLLNQIFGSRKLSLIGSVIYAFFTSHWTISSQGLWRHSPIELCFVFSLFFLLKFEETKNIAWLFLSSIAAAPLFPVRPTGLFYLLSMAAYIFMKHRRLFLSYIFLPVVLSMMYLVFNAAASNSSYLATSPIWRRTLNDVVAGFLGVFFSPSRGFFIYTPLYVFAFVGIWLVIKKRRLPSDFFRSYLPVAIFTVILSGATYATGGLRWWAGWCWGPRFFVDALPALTIYLMVWFRELESYSFNKRLACYGLLFVLAGWSLFTQVVGAFYYKHVWDSMPVHLSKRVWDWKENPITVELRTGPDVADLREKFKRALSIFHLGPQAQTFTRES